MSSASDITRSVSARKGPWATMPVTIRRTKSEIAGVTTYDLGFRDPADRDAYQFVPGQFNMLYLPGVGEVAISVSDDPASRDTLAHTIRIAGNVTGTLSAMQVGESLGLRGPFGSCWPLDDCIGRDVILVAGGIGLAPLRPVIFELLRHRRQFGRLHLLLGARTPDMLLYQAQYSDWIEQGMTVQTTVDRSQSGWQGNVGVVTMLLDQIDSFDAQNTVLLCCGPEVMMRYCVMSALDHGMQSDQIWVSLERNMQCAVGHCGHCQLGPAFVCKEGPVFRYDQVASFIDVEAF